MCIYYICNDMPSKSAISTSSSEWDSVVLLYAKLQKQTIMPKLFYNIRV